MRRVDVTARGACGRPCEGTALRSVTSITVAASAQQIYDIAHDTARWPQILPHYRFVRVLADGGEERTIEMAATRGIFRVRWTAIQRNDPEQPAIYFKHIRGWTAGMDVVWQFQEKNGTTQVSIVHDVVFRFPFARRPIERYVVTKFFIEGIAGRTLACIKRVAEGRANG
ncbi:MAG TPA: SRPBCC family protein [Candidatus Baltobacteraceae bacterium]|nr:SRPBCC family protein [Candidatus Baltobacteraceae bacterium]